MSMTKGLGLGVVAGGALGFGIAFLALRGAGDTGLSDGTAPPSNTTAVNDALLATLKDKAAKYDAAAQALKDAESLRTDLATRTDERDALQTEVSELRASVSRLKAAKKGPSGPSVPGPANEVGPFRFGLKAESPIFDRADWSEMGNHARHVIPFLPEFMKEMLETGQPSQKSIKLMMRHNMPMAQFTLSAQEEIDGTGPNGPFTHPAVMANLLRGALAAFEKPLTADQESSIARIGEEWAKAEQRRLASYPMDVIALRKVHDEIAGKQVFADAVYATLTPDQVGVLYPDPDTRHRMQLDLFSPALIYALRQPVPAGDRSTLETLLVQRLLARAEATEFDAKNYQSLGASWLDGVGSAWLQPVAAQSTPMLFPKLGRLQACALAQCVATENLLAQGQLAPEQAKKLRESETLFQPYVLGQ